MRTASIITMVAAVAFAIVAGLGRAGLMAPHQASNVMLVYIGADDCAPCRDWQREGEREVLSSAKFARLTYRAVKSPSLLDVLRDENWPEDLRVYRDRLGPGAGVPTWLVVVDDQLLVRAGGASEWRKTVLPQLEALLR